MWLLMRDVPVDQVVWVLQPFDMTPFNSFLVVTLLGVLKEMVKPVRWLICVELSPVRTC